MYLIIADVHQGLTRKTGVTAESLERFENDKAHNLANLLDQHTDKEVIIAGDLFDSHQVALYSVLQIASALLAHPKKVWVIAGNHDLSKNTLKMSSLSFFHEWVRMHDTNIQIIVGPTSIGDNHEILAVPHMPNQETFDEVLATSSGFDILITHCNYDNNFTIEKDHSLNLTKKQASKFKMVISGHEHNKRNIKKVHMVGAFAPCNVGEAGVEKLSHVLDSSALTIEPVKSPAYEYEEVHWQYLEHAPAVDFIKIIGEATAAEAPTVLSSVAAFRKKSSAYMIQNAVMVETIELGEIEGASFDSVNTMELLGNILTDKHKNRLEALGYAID